jgi:hypothetical protein
MEERRVNMMRIGMLCAAALVWGWTEIAGSAVSAEEAVQTPGIAAYIDKALPESAEAREARHRRVAARRAQPTFVLVHRGASAFAPENSLEAYAAAMDFGADGVEIDIRRSADGVLYLLHDDTLDRMTTGTGKAAGRTYRELLEAAFKKGPRKEARQESRSRDGNETPPVPEPRIPTLAAFLEVARQRAMLLHLDIKEPGLQDDIAAIFDGADVWDQIVSINNYNSDALLRRPGLQLFGYKGWIEEAGDLANPETVKRFLARPDRMIFCKEDPRPALKMLGRETQYRPVALPKGIRKFTN